MINSYKTKDPYRVKASPTMDLKPKRVFCKNCKFYQSSPKFGDDRPLHIGMYDAMCVARANKRINPINGEPLYSFKESDLCIKRNEDLNCNDFRDATSTAPLEPHKKRKPWYKIWS